ncbi:energy-coupling factor transporter ATPase [Ureaplasma zalophigenitalium]|uniref:Energy-coupling factor transporter ATPase n=1 Tax=Ureaplasma zalophigenitalium TaxID=907723 RepID=A0ABT3BP49_9BACT|nr:energy-coupling factor transporter ATPase [Ureaplasma zalophigenitalium]MCV3754014.1 energy-coupling factor transporter ATPase [Ureaplasma zalophigenitalium]
MVDNINNTIKFKDIDNLVHDSETAVSFENVFFSYNEDRVILKDVSFEINQNEYVCIIGHNGSGKSTISKVLTGLLKPASGAIKLFGIQINEVNLKFLRNNIGIVFQNPDNQFVGITAEDDIAFGLENRKVPPHQMWDIIAEAAKAAGVYDLLKRESLELSGGQKQRVAIASVLAINPSVIIFDESTSMLDPKGKRELKDLMIGLRDVAKKTIISITHDMEEVINADKVIVMKAGEVQFIGKPQDVFENEEKLKAMNLDIPFTLKLSKLLKQSGLNVDLTLNNKELIKRICQK